ncbi:F420H(2):quinone oxidoreductase [Stenotrophomonas sp. Betaine-02u-21]|uniref:BLUF domain-containing protein n=1 Tax=unclassified Stenotrophomonas TaxID=196198 RepID=UPI000C320FFA|nr:MULTISPECIES: BLUF domain-containing protein [unclassified Stenotrophomonas]PKH70333.1 F420H(2):quinone oxidoreductase [Stenotrophomonas sp. Betaine-02u-23]PKH72261.1 F420H(2):quinone oxidoreductase [Stenotrophomonas sp. Betaine-02u-21]PKH96065.1 F420H(2):quinone oxidoreductase [Stenotrophomonas sp. Bg11-02]
MPIQALTYTSDAAPGLGADQVEWLARKAAVFNVQAGVTGVLLFDGSRFLQYLEGPQDGLEVVFSRILNAKLHSNVVELGRGRSGRRNFHYWSMRRFSVERAELDGLVSQDWGSFVLRPLLDEGSRHHGVEALASTLVPHIAR